MPYSTYLSFGISYRLIVLFNSTLPTTSDSQSGILSQPMLSNAMAHRISVSYFDMVLLLGFLLFFYCRYIFFYSKNWAITLALVI
jgi:hypothetical protein